MPGTPTVFFAIGFTANAFLIPKQAKEEELFKLAADDPESSACFEQDRSGKQFTLSANVRLSVNGKMVF